MRDHRGEAGKTEKSASLSPAPLIYTGFVPIPPVPKGRPRFNMRTRRTYTPKETASYESAVRKWFRSDYGAMREPMDGPLSAIYEFVVPRPSGASRGAVMSSTKPDIDNFVKAFQDAMDFKKETEGRALGVIANDSRIASVATVKRYARDGEACGTWFRIEPALWRVVVDVRRGCGERAGARSCGADAHGFSMSLPIDASGLSSGAAPAISFLDPRIPRLRLDDIASLGRARMKGVGVVIALGLSACGAKDREEIVSLLERALPDLERIVSL